MRLGVIPLPGQPPPGRPRGHLRHRHRQDGPGHRAALRADARPQVRDLHGLAAPTAAAPTGTATRSPRASTRSSRSTSTSPAARRGPRRCSRASCCCRSASTTRTWPSAGRVSRLSSADTTDRPPRPTTEAEEADAVDERREAVLADAAAPSSATPSSAPTSAPATTSGSASTATPGATPATVAAQRRWAARFFDFLSAIDWLPSPFGRDMDAQEDLHRRTAHRAKEPAPIVHGLRRRRHPLPGLRPGLQHLRRHCGVTFKADVPDDDLAHRHLDARSSPAPTGTSARPARCSASTSTATRTCVNLYLPDRLRGPPAAQGLPAARPPGEAVAGHRRRRAHARRRRRRATARRSGE